VKEFVIYTVLRLAVFLASLAVIIGVWDLASDGPVPLISLVVLAFVVSGLASYFLLNRQRAAFARRVEERAARATARFDELRAREDAEAEAAARDAAPDTAASETRDPEQR